MAAIVYPSTLPEPAEWGGLARERRASSSIAGNAALRARSRDQISDLDTSWVYSGAQMSEWRAWYRDTLIKGQLWFAVTAPGAGGWVQRVVRYRTGTLRREALGAGYWRVSCRMEQRGRAVAPDYAPPAAAMTWDAENEAGSWVFTNSNRIATVQIPSGAGVANVISTLGRASGRHYVEIGFNSASAYASHVRHEVGVTRQSPPSAGSNVAGMGCAYRRTGDIFKSVSSVASGSALVSPAVVCIALDIDAGKAWFRQNGGAWIGGGDPAAGTSATVTGLTNGTYYAGASVESPLDLAATLYGRTEDFNYSKPAGFAAWAT